MLQTIKQTADFLKTKIDKPVSTAVILGSGLGRLTQRLECGKRIPYADIPNFPQTTVAGHKGYLHYGALSNTAILAMQGRLH